MFYCVPSTTQHCTFMRFIVSQILFNCQILCLSLCSQKYKTVHFMCDMVSQYTGCVIFLSTPKFPRLQKNDIFLNWQVACSNFPCFTQTRRIGPLELKQHEFFWRQEFKLTPKPPQKEIEAFKKKIYCGCRHP